MNGGSGSDEAGRRRMAFVVLGIMTLVFIVLSSFSFLKSRGQVTPDTISFGPYKADDGKRVFQAYNCMGCHTMVGNGGYLGPDLTRDYERAGPAWLAAFLGSAGSWPTEAALRVQLLNQDQLADTGADTIEAYFKKFPGAAERIQRRGGSASFMPNLAFREGEVAKLIAFLKYTSAMNTESWPPKVEIEGLDKRLRLAHGANAVVPAAVVPATPAPAVGSAGANAVVAAASAPGGGTAGAVAADPAVRGAQLAKEYGCTACHLPNRNRLVGPGWGGLYGSQVKLADGRMVTADDAYLIESIVKPSAKIVAGYTDDMPGSFGKLLKESEISDIVAYIHSLEKQ